MFNNLALDVVIGLVFIYLLYSLLATIIQEIIATKLAFRAKILERAIFRMLEDGKSAPTVRSLDLFVRTNLLKDKKIAAWFYAHPLVKYLGENNYHSKPSYLSAQNFSKVMLDLFKGFGEHELNEAQQINDSIQKGIIHHLPIDLVYDSDNPAIQALRRQLGPDIQNGKGDPDNTSEINPDTKLFLQSIWAEAGADVEIFRQRLEKWFDDTMERATGWYKKHTQNVLLVLGLVLAIAFNVDSISIAKKLTKDPKLREQMVQAANAYLEKNKELNDQLKNLPENSALYNSTRQQADYLTARSNELMDSAQSMIKTDIKNINQTLGLGWGKGFFYYNEGQNWTWVFGWLITALAISLGAPFWFDLLNKLMKLRGSGNKIDSSAQDSQPAANAGRSSPAASANGNTQTDQEAVG
jgi:hypothetical protein